MIHRLTPKANLQEEKRLHLAIGLPLSDEAGLTYFLQRLYDPNAPEFHHYLTPEEFAARFGPTKDQYERVVAFAKNNNLTVTGRHSNRLLLNVNPSVADIQRAFNIHLLKYNHPTENREFFAPDAEPSIEAELPILDVGGLSNYLRPQPRSHQLETSDGASRLLALSGSGPNGTY
jgi:subtilase family serine protease